MRTTLTVLTSAFAASAMAADHQRPNILFCIADDASYHHFSATGCPWVSTPAFDRVCAEGVMFRNCYTPNAKSAPSCAIILTGRYSWQLKEAGNHIANFPAEYKVFNEALTGQGYRVAFTGKGWAPGNPGTVDGNPRLLTGQPFMERKTDAPTDKMSGVDYAGNFVDFLDSAGQGPWMFWYGSHEPHRAYAYGSGVSVGGRSTAAIDRVPAFWPDNEVVRNDMLDYGLEIEYFDHHLGLMLAELEKRGQLENTVIIVTSDNGMPFPRSKSTNYEYAHHMPLAVMWPAGISKPGRDVTDYVSFVDLAPTILELGQADWTSSGMSPAAGESLVPIFKSTKDGRVIPRRDKLVFGRERHDYGRPGNQGYPIRGIIRDGWMYINNLKPHLYPAGNPETGYGEIDASPTKTEILNLWRSGADRRYYALSMGIRPAEELYNLSEDLDCVINLAGDQNQAGRIKALRTELYDILRSQGDPRVVGDGDVFDRYGFDTPEKWNFYERVTGGQIAEPWKQTRWISPTDYDTYKKP
ncbi:MAG: sulfatase [Rikenellaceae bacterium]|jgi:arylsulfatase A-like enzyme|nr:sulfatase [Rikenellaceae bacterium]